MSTPLYHLDWITLSGEGCTDESGVQWILMEEKGFWDSPEPKTDIVERTASHGSYMGPSYYQHRVITLKGRAYAPDARLMRTAWTRVAAIGSGPTQSLDLSCDSEIGTQTCQVRRDDAVITEPMPTIYRNVHGFEFAMQVVAPDPRKYSAQWHIMHAGLPSANPDDGIDFTTRDAVGDVEYRGADFLTADGLLFGASNSRGFLQLTNTGTAPATPIYTLHGPLVMPVLTATFAGESFRLQYNGKLSTGESVVIDPAVPSVLADGRESRRHLLGPAQFSGFSIPAADPDGTAGSLRVGLHHSGAPTTGGYVTAEFRHAWF